jgi:predicted RNA-binding Zn ribbon-like protein
METLEQLGAARPLLIIAGNLALDFANTVDDPQGPAHFDHLGSVDRVLAWAANRGLLASVEDDPLLASVLDSRRRMTPELRRLHRLRQTVQAGFTAVAHGQHFPEPEWRELRGAVAAAITHADLGSSPDGRSRLDWPAYHLATVRYAVAQAAYQLLTGGDLHRVKHCAGCHWLFLDQSKNSSRRWCSMQDCGTSAKMRRYIDRRAARRRPPS